MIIKNGEGQIAFGADFFINEFAVSDAVIMSIIASMSDDDYEAWVICGTPDVFAFYQAQYALKNAVKGHGVKRGQPNEHDPAF